MNNNNAPALATDTAAVLTDFLGWLDHNTDTMDPVMIQMSRESTGERHLQPDHIAMLVEGYIEQRDCEACLADFSEGVGHNRACPEYEPMGDSPYPTAF